jgi:hypothetical protein
MIRGEDRVEESETILRVLRKDLTGLDLQGS